jgi:predicted XRE-type DNA-binding protein
MNDDKSIKHGSTNVFADIGIADAEAHQVKADLVTRMNVVIGTLGWSKAQTARCLELTPHALSRLLRGQFRDIETERLQAWLSTLDAIAANPVARLKTMGSIRLSPEDQRRFAESLINPAEPGEALRRAARRYKELVECTWSKQGDETP